MICPVAVCSKVRLTAAEERATQGCECAGMNRHVVGDERALQKRSSDSILTLILRGASRGVRRSVERGIGGPGD
jgi:hypothetical protein